MATLRGRKDIGEKEGQEEDKFNLTSIDYSKEILIELPHIKMNYVI